MGPDQLLLYLRVTKIKKLMIATDQKEHVKRWIKGEDRGNLVVGRSRTAFSDSSSGCDEDIRELEPCGIHGRTGRGEVKDTQVTDLWITSKNVQEDLLRWSDLLLRDHWRRQRESERQRKTYKTCPLIESLFVQWS
jgi:hypothetical protein